MKSIISKFKKEFSDYLEINDSFVCIYGSQVYNPKTLKSDIDVFFAFRNPKRIDFKSLEKRIRDFHNNNSLQMDDEVPYKNKLIVSYTDILYAVRLKCFGMKNNRYYVPKIKKTKKFLNSRDVRCRLIFYTLTAPHIFLGKDIESYNKFKKDAEKNLIILAKDLLSKQDVDNDAILEILLKNDSDEEGEYYLGYKRIKVIICYLQKIINNNNTVINLEDKISVK